MGLRQEDHEVEEPCLWIPSLILSRLTETLSSLSPSHGQVMECLFNWPAQAPCHASPDCMGQKHSLQSVSLLLLGHKLNFRSYKTTFKSLDAVP